MGEEETAQHVLENADGNDVDRNLKKKLNRNFENQQNLGFKTFLSVFSLMDHRLI